MNWNVKILPTKQKSPSWEPNRKHLAQQTLHQGHQHGVRGHRVARKHHVGRPRACFDK